jgi:hypothetical protein
VAGSKQPRIVGLTPEQATGTRPGPIRPRHEANARGERSDDRARFASLKNVKVISDGIMDESGLAFCRKVLVNKERIAYDFDVIVELS